MTSQSTGSGAGSPLRVLLAEDDPAIQVAIQRMLERNGYMVTTVNNGREAIAALDREPFGIILMDMQMPQMGGWEATIAIRERHPGRGGRVPIIALTASTAPGDRDICLAGGMDGYVGKSSLAEQLLAEMERVTRPASGS
jgi:two-component system, sensor histidine kinase and response regulator